MTASALWTAVVASYDSATLISLTNINAPEATAIVTATGESAAQEVIDLWPLYAQESYDASDASHVAQTQCSAIPASSPGPLLAIGLVSQAPDACHAMAAHGRN